ncbi:MAG: winged helix-turn-helix transcriptional regulator [Microbacteriaceae bacterium]|nr:winged helix-turn-helix transcriptional regulator [Microbacteriaceae bacterium]MCL2793755.1 winged helix-turn-helix transcriptional regulator [Microbacteriaceae bacterium]
METSQGPLGEVVERLRNARTDLTQIEVKAAVGGVPRSLWPTVSAFSNHGGGLVILGLDEASGFAPADGFDAARVRDAVAEAFRPRGNREGPGPLTPTPSGVIDVATVDGASVVVIDIEELPATAKPCFVTTQGIENGSYQRIGDGDRAMGAYGVYLMRADAQQPTQDSTPVDGAELEDLDPSLVDRFIERLRTVRPRSIEGLGSTADILRRHGVLASDGRTPTLAGLLAFGRYPQQFAPQLMVTFASYPGPTKDAVYGDIRMLDRRTLEGPIPTIVDDAIRLVISNLRSRRVSNGAGAFDEPEIPVDAIREAVVNALTHRDYSPMAQGDQVRIELFADRLEVHNPGGIWGGRRVADLYDGVSRSRNARLATLLTDVPMPGRGDTVSENAGSGIPRMTGALGRAGLPAPRFEATATGMTTVLERHGLLTPDVTEWFEDIGAESLEPDQQRALALVHRELPVEDQLLRALLGIDSHDAQDVLRSLVDDGWLRYPARPGEAYRRGARLQHEEVREAAPGVFVSPPRAPSSGTLDERIVEAVRAAGELNSRDIAAAVGSSVGSVRQRLRVLVEQRALVPTASAQSTNRAYRLG